MQTRSSVVGIQVSRVSSSALPSMVCFLAQGSFALRNAHTVACSVLGTPFVMLRLAGFGLVCRIVVRLAAGHV